MACREGTTHIHTGPGGLRTGLPKPAGFKMESLSSMGSTKYNSRLLGSIRGIAHASLYYTCIYY